MHTVHNFERVCADYLYVFLRYCLHEGKLKACTVCLCVPQTLTVILHFRALVKAFYSANLLFDVLKQFGDISEEVGTSDLFVLLYLLHL